MAKRFIVEKFSITDSGQLATMKIALADSVRQIKSITLATMQRGIELRTTRYYIKIGSVPGAYNEAFVLSSSYTAIVKNRVASFTVQPNVNQYVFIARPKRLGKAKCITDNGETYTLSNPLATISITDPLTGFIEDYILQKSMDMGDNSILNITIQ